MTADPLLLSVSEASKTLGISRSELYVLASDGRFGPAIIKFGRRSLIRADSLREWVSANCPPRQEFERRKAATGGEQ
jgi:excisionase family DNA binding protein